MLYVCGVDAICMMDKEVMCTGTIAVRTYSSHHNSYWETSTYKATCHLQFREIFSLVYHLIAVCMHRPHTNTRKTLDTYN